MYTGIYTIQNTATGDQYIGQAVNLRKRKNHHFFFLNKGTHKNKHLQNAFDKYGKDSFRFSVLVYCEQYELTRYEQGLVDKLKPAYNIWRCCVESSRGVKYSEETKSKISAALIGKKKSPLSQETKDKISLTLKGGKKPPRTDEWKRKQSLCRIGVKKSPFSPEHRKNMSLAQKGKHFSEEHKKHMSESRKGQVAWNKGKTRAPLSEETKNTILV